MKWRREEYIDLMTFGDMNRPMFVELFGPLIGLEDEWREQGASEDEICLTAFDFDHMDIFSCGGNTGVLGGYKPCIIEDNEQYTISSDVLGRKTKLCKGFATISLPLDFPVKDFDSWLKIKPFFEYSDIRIDRDKVEKAKRLQDKGALIVASIPGGFDTPRELMGELGMSFAYYDDPDLMNDIIKTISDTSFRVLDQISDKLVIDNLMIHEDMAGKSGPLIGPDLISEFIKPYYKRITEMLYSKGTKLFCQDSDGNMDPVIDIFMESGINVMLPIEPASGMDMVEMREKYGCRLAFKGGIDKHVLRENRSAIRKELEYKLQPKMHKGTVFGLDHRITNGTTIENYRYYVDTAREILGLPSRGGEKGWGRMAF